MMYNFTEAGKESEASTALGQNISEEATTKLVKLFTKSVKNYVFSNIHMYGLIILFPFGIFFNSLSLIVFQKSKTFSTSIGNHLKCISISDSIILVGILLTNTDKYWEEKLNFPDIHSMNMSCKISTCIKVLGILSSGLITSSATMERFLALAFPHKYHSWNTFRTSKIILSMFFLFSFGVAVSIIILVAISEKDECDIIEKHAETADLLYTIFIVVIANGICGVVILIFTIIIIILLFHQSRKINVLNDNVSSNLKKEIKFSVMLVIITLLFILLRYPKVVARKLILANSGDDLLIQSLEILTTVLVAINHSVNFIIYMIFLKSFRKIFCKMFSCFHVKIIECLYICRRDNADDG